MENLEQSKILDLGKAIVKELLLDSGGDITSKWMAHYLAEKIQLVEQLPFGVKKDKAEKECFEMILKLWENKWLMPYQRRTIEEIDPILRILERLNPEAERPLFFEGFDRTLFEVNSEETNASIINDIIEKALNIDKSARIWINSLIHQIASLVEGENSKKLINHILSRNDYSLKKFETFFIYDVYADNPENHDEELEKLKRRIVELKKFNQLNNDLVNLYTKQMEDIQNNK